MFQPLDQCGRIGRGRSGVRHNHRLRDSLQSRALRSGLPFLSILVLLAAIFLSSCGGLASSAPPPSVIVTLSPASAQPFAGATVPFVANVQNAGSSAISWQVNMIPGGNFTVGTISDSGLFTAPAVVPNPPTVTVTAVLQTDPSRSASASVTIQSQSSIQGPLSLSPALSSLTTSQTLQLQVTTVGVNNDQVNWAVDGFPNGNPTVGTITATGLYSPPGTAGSHLIIAELKLNLSSIGSAQVKVTDFPGTLTWRNDNSRTGQNTKEFALAPSTVNSSTFGKLFSCPLDGYSYTQPLYVPNLNIPGTGTRNVVIVATAKDSVFAFDADSNPCVQLWRKNLVPAGEEAVPAPNVDIPSDDIAPFIGITGTPVIDVTTDTLYAVAETRSPALPNPTAINTIYVYIERLYALDLATGQPKIQPAGIDFSTSPAAGNVFDSRLANQRAALLLDNGNVYVAFASHHGVGGYHGWLFSYDASTLQQNSVFDVTPASLYGGIWQSGGGPSADSNHNVL